MGIKLWSGPYKEIMNSSPMCWACHTGAHITLVGNVMLRTLLMLLLEKSSSR